MTEFVAYRLNGDGNNDAYATKVAKKSERTNKCVIKRRLMFNNHKNCLIKYEIILKSQQRFKSEPNNVYNEGIDQIALSSNDDKRLQMIDGITSYSYDASVGTVCKTELLSKHD